MQIKISPAEPWTEIVIAELADSGLDSFVTTDDGLLAYGASDLNVDEIVQSTILSDPDQFEYELESRIIPYQNWNEKWESDFEPVYVEDYATIRAPFHEDIEVKGMDVVIQPQMSFGTGHHQTTWLMTKALFELEAMPEDVLDMGTGTGVLAIIAEKLGASHVLAIDIEDWSVENAIENAERNNCKSIECLCGDIDLVKGRNFGLIIANINKNVLKSHMEVYAEALMPGGKLLLSGFFLSDEKELVDYAEQFGLELERTLAKDEWAGLQLTK